MLIGDKRGSYVNWKQNKIDIKWLMIVMTITLANTLTLILVRD
jgi:hypothetical protein